MACIMNATINYAIAEDYVDPLYTLDSKEELAVYVNIQANLYSTSAKNIKKVINCESRWNEKAWNKKDPGDGSKGLLQFQDRTFLHYAKKIGIENPDIWDSKQQIEVSAYMFSINQERQWTCARIML